jgi:uncharacterized protein
VSPPIRLLAMLALCLAATPLAAVPLWSVKSATGEVLLLGSIHMLRAEDHPLPETVQQAYRRAGRILMELDPADLDPAAAQAALQRVGIMSAGRSVPELLSAEELRNAEELAASAGMNLQAVAGLETWFAALVLYNGALAAAGYDPAYGVDQQIAAWAERDGTPVDGLETMEQQLSLFKELDVGTQRHLLLKTLEELTTLEADTAALVRTWRKGDIESLERHLEEDFQDFQALRARIVEDRNRAWLPVVAALLEEPGTSLVVVGALHLVGPGGLPALLAERLPDAQISIISKSSLPAPQSGQRQLNGTSSQRVPGARPPSGSPSASSYTYPQITHIQAFIQAPPRR